MNDIRHMLRTAARRIELNRFAALLNASVLVAAGLVLVLMAVDRVGAAAFMPWWWLGPSLGAAALLCALILWQRGRARELHVAMVVDERLELREKLSTALHCQGREDAFAQAALQDAVAVARDGRTRERLRRQFSFIAPRGWWFTPLAVFLAIMISFVKPLNLLARDAQNQQQVQQAKLEAQESLQAVVKLVQEKPELRKELPDLLGDLSTPGQEAPDVRMPEDQKRQAIKKITDLNRKLEDLLSGERGKAAAAISESLSQLKPPEEDTKARELAESMAKGDFAGAQQALKEMLDKLQKGDMSPQDREKLVQQLQDIAKQLEQLANQQKQLEEALKQAGMDAGLAQSPQALQEAIQNNQNLNQQQKQQLQQMAQAQQAACKACQGLGAACQAMAQACKSGQMGQCGQAGQQMGGQLGQLEAMQQLLKEAQAAASACQGQCQGLGQGLNMQLAMQQWCQGGAFGNRGIGAGGKAPIAPTPVGSKAEKANVNTVEGDVIAKTLFEGPLQRGESKAKVVQVVKAASKDFEEGLAEDVTHRKYHEAMQHYFGELQKLARSVESQGHAGPAPPKAEDSKDSAPASKPRE